MLINQNFDISFYLLHKSIKWNRHQLNEIEIVRSNWLYTNKVYFYFNKHRPYKHIIICTDDGMDEDTH